MDTLILPGDSCFTSSEAKKLTERSSKNVKDIRGVWIHYVCLSNSSEQRHVKVRSLDSFRQPISQ
jgi:hypothetical protein